MIAIGALLMLFIGFALGLMAGPALRDAGTRTAPPDLDDGEELFNFQLIDGGKK